MADSAQKARDRLALTVVAVTDLPRLARRFQSAQYVGRRQAMDAAEDLAVAVLALAERLERGAQAEARLAAVEALHRPWYVAGGIRYENTVLVYCDDYMGCDGTDDHPCEAALPRDGEHDVPACSECRCVVEDDMDGFLLWPCPTAKALGIAAPAAADGAEVGAPYGETLQPGEADYFTRMVDTVLDESATLDAAVPDEREAL